MSGVSSSYSTLLMLIVQFENNFSENWFLSLENKVENQHALNLKHIYRVIGYGMDGEK